jgi:DNA-binding protein HU-beta
MTKIELVGAIKARLADSINTKHIHQMSVTSSVLDALGEVAGAALAGGGEVPLPGIGKLKAKQRKARTGRNPRTGDPVDIPAHMGVKFEPGKALTDKLKRA